MRYSYEKFYEDRSYRENMDGPRQGYYRRHDDGSYQYHDAPPPNQNPNPNKRGRSGSYWSNMDYETVFIW